MKWTWSYPIEDLDLWLLASFGPKGKGSWCGLNSVAEGFGPDKNGSGWSACTHIHFYGDRQQAIQIWREMRRQGIDLSGIRTYSHDPEETTLYEEVGGYGYDYDYDID